MPSTSDTGCSCTVSMTFVFLARPLTCIWFAQVTRQIAMRSATNLCLSGNGLIFVIRTPTFTVHSNLPRFGSVKPVTGLPKLIGMHLHDTPPCFATPFPLSTSPPTRSTVIAGRMFLPTSQPSAILCFSSGHSRRIMRTSTLALDKRSRTSCDAQPPPPFFLAPSRVPFSFCGIGAASFHITLPGDTVFQRIYLQPCYSDHPMRSAVAS